MGQEDWRLLPFTLLLVLTGVPTSKPRGPMTRELSRYAALTTARGALLVAFGLVGLGASDPSAEFMLRAFAIFSLAEGLAAVVAGYRASLPQPIVSGALSVVIGIIALGLDEVSAGALTLLVVTAAVVRGGSDLSLAQLFKYATGRDQYLRVEAIVSLLFVVAMVLALALGGAVPPALMTTYALLAGGSLLLQSVSTCWVIAALEPRGIVGTVPRRAPRSA